MEPISDLDDVAALVRAALERAEGADDHERARTLEQAYESLESELDVPDLSPESAGSD